MHMQHEWVILANLFLLLMGFALLSRHFEKSRIPDEMPALLPDDWKGGVALLAIVFVLSSFLDNIAAALIGGTVARHVFRGKVHIGYLAAIVAASNAGGAGSVVGDTTTTMMWIAGVSPLSVLDAYVAAGVALLIFAVPAAMQQQRFSPILKHARRGLMIEWMRLRIVAAILHRRAACQRDRELEVSCLARRGAGPRAGCLGSHSRHRSLATTGLGGHARDLQGHDLPAGAGYRRLDDARRKVARGRMADGARSWVRVSGFRQYPADGAGPEAGRLRLGLSRLCGRLRRIDDLVRLFGRGGAREHLSGSASVGLWLRHGWHVAVAYVVGFFVMLALLGWHPDLDDRLRTSNIPVGATPAVVQAGPID